MKIRDIKHTDPFLIRNFGCDITKLSSIDSIEDGSLGFCLDINMINFYSTNNTLIVLDKKWMKVFLNHEYEEIVEKGNYIFSDIPRSTFTKIAYQILEQHPVEYVKKVGKNFKFGNNCVINNCIIGNTVSIGDNAVIGNAGFGYVETDNEILQFPHVGKVIIGDNVKIHSNVCIDRGSLSDTIIGNNCKIDNLVHIAHNAEVGENTLIAARAMVAGGVKIGKNCWIAPGVNIIDRITIADNTTLGIGTTVVRSITEPNGVWVGVPAKRLR